MTARERTTEAARAQARPAARAAGALTRHWWLPAGAGAAALPLVLRDSYGLHLAVLVGINAVVVLGLNLLMGYAGQVSLGQAAFVGIGAYASAVISGSLGLSPWLGVAAGIGLGATTAALVGAPLLKLRGHYLAMGTLGFGMIANIVMAQWQGLTRGDRGISVRAPLSVAGLALDTELRRYYLVAAVVLAAMVVAANIIDSRVGRAMRAVHGSEVAAAVSGVDTQRYKVRVFVLSGALAALAGSLYAHHSGYVNPDSFGFHYSILLVVMAVLGGMSSIGGALVGAAAVTLINEQLRWFQEFSTIIFGALLMGMMVFLPSGIWAGAAGIVRRLGRLRRAGRRDGA